MPVDPTRLQSSIDQLSHLRPTGDLDTHTALEQVADACVRLFRVAGSGIMLADQQSMLRYVASSDEAGRRLEVAESESAEGPCTDAFVHLRTVDSADAQADDRWPRLARALHGTEVRAVLGVPVRRSGIPVGTLDVYRDPGPWDDDERTALGRYADVIGHLLGSTVAAQRSQELAGQLQYALDYRVVIERGVGYLMARDRVDAVTAFTTLRAAARSSRTRIGQVAEALLASGVLPAE